jgi:pSer/pThr/pTyr-binding forkhead associated (FHA) protein
MFAHLVPCSGGHPIALSRSQLFLGRRREADKAAPLNAERAVYRLRKVEGNWHIDLLDSTADLRVNGKRRRAERLKSGDELTLGRIRFRFDCPSPVEMQLRVEAIADEVLRSDEPLGDLPGQSADQGIPPHESFGDQRSKPAEPCPSEPAPCLPAAGTPAAHPSAGVLGRLIPVGGGTDFPLRKPFVIVGRATACDICLPFRTVSSRHCELRLDDGHWQIVDIGSQNGIRVDGHRCRQGWVFPETLISIADQRFQIDYVPIGERPAIASDDPRRMRSLTDLAGLKGQRLEELLARIAASEKADVPERVIWDLRDDI